MTCFMQYSKLGDDEYLQGTYYSTSVSDSTSGCGKGSIFLHRVSSSDFHKEPFLEKKENELLARKKATIPIKPPATASANPPPVAPVKPGSTSKAGTVKSPAKTTVPKTTTVRKQPRPAAVDQHVAIQTPGARSSLQTQNGSDSTIKIKQPEIPVLIPYVLRTRTNSLLKTLTFNHDNVEIRIYDDGAIDNDTVSVYYDNKLIISKARLTDQAISMHLRVDPSDHPHQLVMVAENLGDIPPNTSLLVVIDGEKKYEERIISTEQKNVVIDFVYKKTE